MKRLNTETNAPFKSGTPREDGKLFYGYTKRIAKKTGYFIELWLTPNAYHGNRLKRVKNDVIKARYEANMNNLEEAHELN